MQVSLLISAFEGGFGLEVAVFQPPPPQTYGSSVLGGLVLEGRDQDGQAFTDDGRWVAGSQLLEELCVQELEAEGLVHWGQFGGVTGIVVLPVIVY